MLEASAGIGVPVTGSPGMAELFGMASGDGRLLQLLSQQLSQGKTQGPQSVQMQRYQPGQIQLPMYRPRRRNATQGV